MPLSVAKIMQRRLSTNQRVWSTRGVMLTGEKRSARRKTCPSATFITTKPTRTGAGLHPGLRTDGATKS
jgi:hypothetical protein